MRRGLTLALSLLVGCSSTGSVDAAAPPIDVGPEASVSGDAAAPLDAGPAGDTWATYATGFFDTYCVRCHSGAPSGRDYRTIADVRRDVARIRCGVAPVGETPTGCGPTPAAGMFPVGSGPFPSAADRRRLVEWLDAGLRE